MQEMLFRKPWFFKPVTFDEMNAIVSAMKCIARGVLQINTVYKNAVDEYCKSTSGTHAKNILFR